MDHCPLVAIINSKSLDQITSPHFIRLKEKLSPYCMTAVWRPGAQHKVVDCFSRHPVEDADSDDDGADIDACLMATQSTRTMIQVRQLWKMLTLSKSEMLVRGMTLIES